MHLYNNADNNKTTSSTTVQSSQSSKSHLSLAVPKATAAVAKEVVEEEDMSRAFEVCLRKNARGLGFSVVTAGRTASEHITIKKCFLSEPAALAGLREGDLLLKANSIALRGLSSAEAINLFHALPEDVILVVYRPKEMTINTTLTESELRSATSTPTLPLNSIPSEFNDEQHLHLATAFDVHLVKQNGSLGFTILKKEDGGLFVKEVLKEPAACSKPKISPGDRILLVNGKPQWLQ